MCTRAISKHVHLSHEIASIWKSRALYVRRSPVVTFSLFCEKSSKKHENFKMEFHKAYFHEQRTCNRIIIDA